MTLNIDLEDVPFAIFEAVKARILANRRKLGQQAPPPSLRPRPQFVKIGANSKIWRLPKPAAIPLDDSFSPIGHAWWLMSSERVENDGYFATAGGLTSSPRVYRQLTPLGFKRTSRIYCGDGSQHVEIVHGQQAQQMIPQFTGFPPAPSTVDACVSYIDNVRGNDNADLIALPAGRDVFVLVFFAWNVQAVINTPVSIIGESSNNSAPIMYPSTGAGYQADPQFSGFNYYPLSTFTKVEQATKMVKTFVCSNTSIREISPPGGFASLLNVLLPPPTNEPYTYGTGFPGTGGGGQIVANSTIPTFAPAYLAYNGQGMGDAYIYANTPTVYYDSCNEVTEGTPPASQTAWSNLIGSRVKPLPSSLRWLIPDTSSGAYTAPYVNAGIAGWFNARQPFRYGQWITPGEEPGYLSGDDAYYYDTTKYQPQPDRTFIIPPGPSFTAPIKQDNELFGNALYAVWDWDDPDYCRSVCLALGFSASDLQP